MQTTHPPRWSQSHRSLNYQWEALPLSRFTVSLSVCVSGWMCSDFQHVTRFRIHCLPFVKMTLLMPTICCGLRLSERQGWKKKKKKTQQPHAVGLQCKESYDKSTVANHFLACRAACKAYIMTASHCLLRKDTLEATLSCSPAHCAAVEAT